MTQEQPNFTSSSSIWALLVGIDDYPYVDKLRGCVNDVKAMEQFLVNKLGVPKDHIHVLINQDATRDRIIQTFQKFLIDNPRIEKENQILFHYSGHGSQMPNQKNSNILDQSLVPYDSRTSGVYDIPDKTIAGLLDQLALRKGNNITVILDSCHSGSGTRDPNLAQTRNVAPDIRIPPTDLDADILAGATRRGGGSSGSTATDISHVLLAACRNNEEAREHHSCADNQQKVVHGALTYFLLQELSNIVPNTTYAELHEQVKSKVNTIYSSQRPQCEGDRNRVVFGGVRVQRDPFITVGEVKGDTVILEAGLLHGLQKDTELALYLPDVKTKENLPSPLASVKVTSVSATTSEAKIVKGSGSSIPIRARALVTKLVYVGLRKTVALVAAEGEENQSAIQRLRQAIVEERSPYLEVLEKPNLVADLRVKAIGGQLSIHDSTDYLLVDPKDINVQDGNLKSVLSYLENIARYLILQDFPNNKESSSRLVGKVKIGLRHYVERSNGHEAQELPQEAVDNGEGLILKFDPEHEERNNYVVDVINNSLQRVYANVLILNPDYSIKLLYPPEGLEEAIEPNKTLSIGLDRQEELLKIYLPDEWDYSRDRLKVILTTNPTNLKQLEQEDLKIQPPQNWGSRGENSALDQLFATVLSGGRHSRPNKKSDQEDWAIAELSYTIVRAYQTTTLNTPAETISLNNELTLIKPEGFQGQVTVTTLSQATRSLEGNPSLKLPPGLDRFPDLFQPIGRSGTRSIDSSFGSSALVISFDVDEASRQSITPNNRLRLELPTVANEEAADLLAIAFDGEDYLPVGYAAKEKNAVDVVILPPTVVSTDAQSLPTKRGIGRTIELFVYKKMGRYTPQIGLRRVELVDGKVQYHDIQRNQFQSGDTVALFVHGFTADTRQMVETFAPFLRDEVFPYKHLLTWDYETFGTSVEENGAKLALALQQQCGFSPDDQITVHIYAHSMGCLVSRCMIELSGGHKFVDKLVMAGPPNNGSTLATLGRGIVYLLTLFVNQASVIPPLGAFNWLLEPLYQQGVGSIDLIVNSAILDKLNALKEPSNVPYLVLAGENRLSEAESKRLNRLAQKVLDRTLDNLFGEQNDIAVGLSSMRDLRGEAYPKLTIEVLDCDHFEYFQIPQGREAVKRWVTNLSV